MLIHYYGSCGLLNGYGQAANEMVLALAGAGANVEVRVLNPAQEELRFDGYPGLEALLRDHNDLTPHPDVVIVHAQPFDAARVLASLRERHPETKSARTVVYTTWEGVSRPPDSIASALVMFDQIWLPSMHNVDLVRPTLPLARRKDVACVPHCFDETTLSVRQMPRTRAPDAPFRFYYLGHWNGRKNVPGLIRAFAKAFTADDHVELAIHATGIEPGRCMTAIQACGEGVRDDTAKIVFSNNLLTYYEVLSYHRDGDCFVTATRGEAWNMPAFHALLAGNMIIHPRGTGAREFLRGTTAQLPQAIHAPSCDDIDAKVDAEGNACLVFSNGQGMSARTDWLEPDLNDIARTMRQIYDRPYDRHARRLEVTYNVAETFGRKSVGAFAVHDLLTAALRS